MTQRKFDRRSALAGIAAATAVLPVFARLPGTGDYEDPDDMYEALGSLPAVPLSIREATIRVVFAGSVSSRAREAVLGWIRTAAEALVAYFGRFPVSHYALLVIPEPGGGVGHATTFGYAGPATRIHVGVDATADQFRRDWVLVHEMVHTALPNLPRRALWLQEGNATYVEPIARALIGQIPASEVWREAVSGMPKGTPRSDEAGMDETRRWGRLYWGGATFWLAAEIAIYLESRGTRSLRDALRRINRESGGNASEWEPERVVREGDKATGTGAMTALYARFATTPVRTDLSDTFRRLGVVSLPDGSVRFDDGAPLADLRRRITTL